MRALPLPEPPGIALACVAACALAWLPGIGATAADPSGHRVAASAARPPVIVDQAVTPAGGQVCRHCGGVACRIHHGHLADCRDGHCAPHCPVRPGQHGFYGTQWRRWPGQGVVPVSAEDAATPVRPPPSQVPEADEESPRSLDAEALEPGSSSAPADSGRPAAALPTDPLPEQPGSPGRPDPAARRPATEPPLPPSPPGEPPLAPEARDGADLQFDESSLPLGEEEPLIDAGPMRYPAQVGRLPNVRGGLPRRVQPAAAQRAVDSARGR